MRVIRGQERTTVRHSLSRHGLGRVQPAVHRDDGFAERFEWFDLVEEYLRSGVREIIASENELGYGPVGLGVRRWWSG